MAHSVISSFNSTGISIIDSVLSKISPLVTTVIEYDLSLTDFFHLMNHLTHLSCKLVTCAGTLILVKAVVLALINILSTFLNAIFGMELSMFSAVTYGSNRHSRKAVATFGRVRQQLGEITALGLEVLVVADILETLTKSAHEYSWDALGKIIVIACFRSLLAIMLGREIKEIDEKIEEMDITHTQEMMKKLKMAVAGITPSLSSTHAHDE